MLLATCQRQYPNCQIMCALFIVEMSQANGSYACAQASMSAVAETHLLKCSQHVLASLELFLSLLSPSLEFLECHVGAWTQAIAWTCCCLLSSFGGAFASDQLNVAAPEGRVSAMVLYSCRTCWYAFGDEGLIQSV